MAPDDLAQMRRVYETVRQLSADEPDASAGVTAGQVAASTGLDLNEVSVALDVLAARAIVRLERHRDPAAVRAMPYHPPPLSRTS